MRVAFDTIPSKIVEQCHLQTLVHDGWIYMEIRKDMPGLKQAGIFANDRLVEYLAKYDYSPVPRTPAIWCHHIRNIICMLCVDSFGVKYINKSDVEHLLNALRDLYTMSVDCKGEAYIGFTFFGGLWMQAGKYTNAGIYCRRPPTIKA